MIPIKVTQPKYNQNNVIDCLVVWDMYPNDTHPFTASPDDPESHGQQLYLDLVSGLYGDIAPYSSEDAEQDRIVDNKNRQADLLQIAEHHLIPLRDEALAGIISAFDQQHLAKWVEYAKTLRNLDTASPEIEWPTPPEHN